MIKNYCDSRECKSEMFYRFDEKLKGYYCMNCGRNYITLPEVERIISKGKVIPFPSIEDELRHKELIKEIK